MTVFENSVRSSTSLLETGQSCLEDLLDSLPNLPSARMLFSRDRIPKESALASQKIGLTKSRLSAHVGQDIDSPEIYSTFVRYSTNRNRLLPVDGGMLDVNIRISTNYSFPSLPQDERFQQSHHVFQTGSHKDFQSDWHHDALRRVLSGNFNGVQDLANRLAQTLWSLNEENALAMPLDVVEVTLYPRETKPKRPEDSPFLCRIAIRLNRLDFERAKHSASMTPCTSDEHTAYIALGSNVDDRIASIESACRLMQTRGIAIERTSALYETAPMYYENQPPFINGVCQVG